MADATVNLSLYTGTFGTQQTPFSQLVKVAYEKPFLATLNKDVFVWDMFEKKNTKDNYIRWKVKTTFNQSAEFVDEDDALGTGYNSANTNADPAGDYVPANWINPETTLRFARSRVQYTDPVEVLTDSAWLNMRAEEVGAALGDLTSEINSSLVRFVESGTTNASVMPDTLLGPISTGATTAQNSNNAGSGQVTYATINRTTVSAFRSVVLGATAARALTLAQMNQLFASLTVSPTRKVNPGDMVILTTSGISDSYGDIADARRRWNTPNAKIDLGYGEFEYKNIPIQVPPIWHVEGANISDMVWINKPSWKIYVGKAFNSYEIGKTVAAPMLNTMIFETWFNLVCKEPWKQGIITALSSSY